MSSFYPIQNAINLVRILQFTNERESGSFNRIIVGAFLRISFEILRSRHSCPLWLFKHLMVSEVDSAVTIRI